MPKPGRFWWFRGASVVALARRLEAAGPATCRLEVHLGEDDKMTLRVVADGMASLTTSAPEPDINESFACPPICPE